MSNVRRKEYHLYFYDYLYPDPSHTLPQDKFCVVSFNNITVNRSILSNNKVKIYYRMRVRAMVFFIMY